MKRDTLSASSHGLVLVLGTDLLAAEALATVIDPTRSRTLCVAMIQAVGRIDAGDVDAVVLLPRAVDPTLLFRSLRRNRHTRLIIATSGSGSLPPAFLGVESTLVTTLDDLRRHLDENQPQSMVAPLTGRQLEILQRIADGDSPTEAATHLGITVKTLNNHLGTIYRRLGTRNGTQAVLVALRNRFISL